jgi:hypothetical protein
MRYDTGFEKLHQGRRFSPLGLPDGLDRAARRLGSGLGAVQQSMFDGVQYLPQRELDVCRSGG